MKLTERDFESDFCLECVDYGEPNGCNRSTGECGAYAFCQEAWDELNEYRNLEKQGRLVRVVRCCECEKRLNIKGKPLCDVYKSLGDNNYYCKYGKAEKALEREELK